MSKTDTTKSQRDFEIACRSDAGQSNAALARSFNLSPTRIRQIIASENGRP
jgi:Mor family transcriptional regulator